MGKIFHWTFKIPQKKALLVSYFGYNCGMMNVVFFINLSIMTSGVSRTKYNGDITVQYLLNSYMEIYYEITNRR